MEREDANQTGRVRYQDRDQILFQTFNGGEAWGPRSDLGGRGPSAMNFLCNNEIRYITSIQGNKY